MILNFSNIIFWNHFKFDIHHFTLGHRVSQSVAVDFWDKEKERPKREFNIAMSASGQFCTLAVFWFAKHYFMKYVHETFSEIISNPSNIIFWYNYKFFKHHIKFVQHNFWKIFQICPTKLSKIISNLSNVKLFQMYDGHDLQWQCH